MLYLIIGRKEGYEDIFYGVCHTLEKAEEFCYYAEASDENGRYYEWFPVLEIEN